MTETDGGTLAPSIDFEVIRIDLVTDAPLVQAEEQRVARLSADDISRAANFGSDKERAQAWRASRIAARIILERWVGATLRRQPFVIEPGGRPRLSAGAPWFSIAHSDDVALVAVSDVGPVGVDVEAARVIRISRERRARIIAASAALRSSANIPAEAHLTPAPLVGWDDARTLQAWVRLEAVAKASGAGIGRLLTDAGVVGAPGGREVTTDAAGFMICDLDVGAGRFGAVAGGRLPPAIVVRDFPSNAGLLTEFLAEQRRRRSLT